MCHLKYFKHCTEIKGITYFFTPLEIFLLSAKVSSFHFVSSRGCLKHQPLFHDSMSPKARIEDSTWYAADPRSIFCVCAGKAAELY